MDTEFEATCETCGAGQFLKREEIADYIGDDGSFKCDACANRIPKHQKLLGRRMARRRYRKPTVDPTRRLGCIVTARRGTKVWTCHRDGKVEEALAEICATLPEGTEVLSISTWRSILRDLKGPPRTLASGQEVDAYAVERALLGKVGRIDLLTRDADPLYDQAQRERRRRGKRAI